MERVRAGSSRSRGTSAGTSAAPLRRRWHVSIVSGAEDRHGPRFERSVRRVLHAHVRPGSASPGHDRAPRRKSFLRAESHLRCVSGRTPILKNRTGTDPRGDPARRRTCPASRRGRAQLVSDVRSLLVGDVVGERARRKTGGVDHRHDVESARSARALLSHGRAIRAPRRWAGRRAEEELLAARPEDEGRRWSRPSRRLRRSRNDTNRTLGPSLELWWCVRRHVEGFGDLRPSNVCAREGSGSVRRPSTRPALDAPTITGSTGLSCTARLGGVESKLSAPHDAVARPVHRTGHHADRSERPRRPTGHMEHST